MRPRKTAAINQDASLMTVVAERLSETPTQETTLTVSPLPHDSEPFVFETFTDFAVERSEEAFRAMAAFCDYVHEMAWEGKKEFVHGEDAGVLVDHLPTSLDRIARRIARHTDAPDEAHKLLRAVDILRLILGRLYETGVVRDLSIDSMQMWISGNCAHPRLLAEDLLMLPGFRRFLPGHDLRWRILRAFRQLRHVSASASTARWFGILSDELSERTIPFYDNIQERIAILPQKLIEAGFKTDNPADFTIPSRYAKYYLDVCRFVYDMPYLPWQGGLVVHSPDTERILTVGFALSTGIRGLDHLLGGGLLLPELPDPEADCQEALPGRTVLIQGRPGTGKTLLSLEIAVKTARAGGIAWVFPLEQPVSEYQYILDVMRLLSDAPEVDVLTTNHEVAALRGKIPTRGALIIISTVRESSQDFLTSLENAAQAMLAYPLRLIVADPINTVHPDTNEPTVERQRLTDTLKKLKTQHINTLLVAERSVESVRNGQTGQDAGPVAFEENVADTVFFLTQHTLHSYTYRTIEVRKSRLQRELRGEHPFTIQSGAGFKVYPSPAAIQAGLDENRWKLFPNPPARKQREVAEHIEYGLKGMDALLGDNALHAGDVMLLRGPAGSYKTPLGLRFLLHSLSIGKEAILFTPDFGEASLEQQLRRAICQTHPDESPEAVRQRIRVCQLPLTHVNPAYLLMRVRQEIERALEKSVVERVMLDGLLRLEQGAPFVRDDRTLPETLVHLLHVAPVTALLVCEDPADPVDGFHFQDALARAADAEIHLERAGAREGDHKVRAWVRRTPGAVHKPGLWEVQADNHGIHMQPSDPFEYRNDDGVETRLSVLLLLHSETWAQAKYNRHLSELLIRRGIMTEFAEPEGSAFLLGLPSASSEKAQVLQIDSPLLDAIKPHLQFPPERYYDNISLLAYNPAEVQKIEPTSTEDILSSWRNIAEVCQAWETKEQVFFEYPRTVDEDYCSLFLEILCEGPEAGEDPLQLINELVEHWPHLANWPKAHEALYLFRRVARPAYLFHSSSRHKYLQDGSIPTVSADAAVWRHWYTTLQAMAAEISTSGHRERIRMRPLPGNMTVSGEWYLGVPKQSAAPGVAQDIIDFLVSRECQMDRFSQSVGLPVSQFRNSSVRQQAPRVMDSAGIAATTPTFSEMQAFAAGLTRLDRSHLKGYAVIAPLLARILRAAIERPDFSDSDMHFGIIDLLVDFQAQVTLLFE